jgi:putative heme-binding domain-containing protein
MSRLRIVMSILTLLFIAALTSAVSGPALAQGPGPAIGPPGPLPNGEQLYNANCVDCHGPEGDVVAGVDLGHGRFRRATTDPELVGIVLRGIPGTGMPPNNFSEAQASAIVQFLRAKASRSAASAGNAANGHAIFFGKGNCASCHRVDGAGARTGPDLSDVGRLRHSPDIEQSILDPDFYIIPSNRTVRLAMRDGTSISGRLLNQDTFTVQILDSKEQLQSLPRSNIREFTFVDKSPMPPYRGKLTSQEMTDLVSYLVSLKGSAQ